MIILDVQSIYHYSADFLFHSLMYFEDSILGNGIAPLIAQLSESTKQGSDYFLCLLHFENPTGVRSGKWVCHF
jgi:hypothetical protein